jgi:two-component system, chemotaxis family, sensor histidine kinase and response regulator PixL
MITSDQEQQVKLQFLDEATDYLDTLESGLLGLGAGKVADKQLDALLRAAHSIKGGAAMMGYTTLARLGHHLEDYFKIIQYGKAAPPDRQIEQLLLATVDKLRQIVALNRQGTDADAAWLEERVNPIFAQLRERLGEFNPEDEANMLASESGEDILTFLFESEVERSLTQLESFVNADSSTSLYDELIVTAEELGGLAEMVELPAFGQLCQSVLAHLTGQPHQIRSIANLALTAWRRTQAMVLIGQTTNLPTEIELPGSGIVKAERLDSISGRSNMVPEQIEPEYIEPEEIDSFALNAPIDLGDLIGEGIFNVADLDNHVEQTDASNILFTAAPNSIAVDPLDFADLDFEIEDISGSLSLFDEDPQTIAQDLELDSTVIQTETDNAGILAAEEPNSIAEDLFSFAALDFTVEAELPATIDDSSPDSIAEDVFTLPDLDITAEQLNSSAILGNEASNSIAADLLSFADLDFTVDAEPSAVLADSSPDSIAEDVFTLPDLDITAEQLNSSAILGNEASNSIAADLLSFADLDFTVEQPDVSAMLFEEESYDIAGQSFADTFADFNTSSLPPLSTITASDELSELDIQGQYLTSFDFQQPLDTTSNAETESEIINGLERLDLTGDLSLDTEDRDLFSALSGVFSGFEIGADAVLSSAAFKLPPEPAIDPLAQEAAALFSALDAAPEISEDLHNHNRHNAPKSNAAANVAEQTIRVGTKQLADIGDLFGELTIDRNGLNTHLQGLRQLVVNLQLKVKQLEQSNLNLHDAYDNAVGTKSPDTLAIVPANTSGSSDFTSELDALEFDRYSELHVLSQDVMDTIVQVEELTTDLDLQLNDAERTTRSLNRTAKQLQTGLTQVRMRPVSELFNRFPRAIRNLSIEHAKPIDLLLKGGTTLIERTILEALNDPLMHLVRNAFDHGIEPSATRRAHGKSDTGTIEINASYRGNQTVITIKDDGGGIDLNKIRAKVKKMGIDDLEIANFKDSELIDLIFEPGFSTAEKVTDLSGRGVGMDVVRTNIRDLNGDISVDTTLGKGSTFTITVPFTVSVIRVLLVEINGMWVAVPSNVVEEIILLNPDQIVTTNGQKMLQWDDFSVRLIQPNQYLRLPDFTPQIATADRPTINCPTVLTIDRGTDVVALEIDKFWGEQEVTVRQPHGNLKLPSGFTGCTILGDGRIVPLLDPIEFIRWIDGDFAVATAINSTLSFLTDDSFSIPAPAAPQRPRILVVDDSINVRRFVALTLEKAGYLVEQAKDGQEAIEKLQSGIQTQAVVCDVEMPRMDGYGFLATVKGLAEFKNIPVLMLTSRSGDKHRKIAMNLGASGYFSKPFQEQELLAQLTELVGV